MAVGGTVQPGGLGPLGGGQQMLPNNGGLLPTDNPVMPIANMDPYTRALYDTHGRLHPYSAQQEEQMGPGGIDAVNSYVSKVQGGDIKQYQDLVTRLKPQTGAPQAGSVDQGFITG